MTLAGPAPRRLRWGAVFEAVEESKHVRSIRSRNSVPAIAWALGVTLIVGGCATEETTNFGDPSRVATSGGDVVVTVAPSSSTGMSCDFNPACEVSFSNDIYPNLLVSAKAGSGGCADGKCHEAPAGGLAIDPSDAKEAHKALLAYVLPNVGPYLTPCEPSASAILCNLKFVKDVENEFYSDICGQPMPKTDSSSPVHSPISKASYDQLVTWIQCGALFN